MPQNHPQSSSVGDASTVWGASRTVSRPDFEKPTELPPSDLGSDDDWHLTMGSDSDPSDPTDILSSSNFINDEPSPVLHDYSQHVLDFDVRNDDDHLPQSTIISGYRGVNSRADAADSPPSAASLNVDHSANAVPRPDPVPQFNDVSEEISANSAAPHPSALASNWADRPRQKGSVESCAAQTTPPASPAKLPTTCDSALSVSHAGSSANGSAFHLSPRSFSDTSDTSGKTPSKTVSFFDGQSSARSANGSHDPVALWPNAACNSVASSAPSSGRLQMTEPPSPSLQTSLKEGKVRLATARFGAPRRLQKRATQAASTAKVFLNHSSGTSSTQGSPFIGPSNPRPPQWSQSPSVNHTSQRPSSTQSEGLPYPRHSSPISQQLSGNQRPLSTPNQSAPDFESSSDTSVPGVFFTKTTLQYGLGTMQKVDTRLGLKTSPLCKQLSFLECVVELLSGCSVLKRKNILYASEAWIWLTPDLTALKYRTGRKGAAPVVHTLFMSTVTKMKGNDRDIALEMIGEKKALSFVLPSKPRADIWMSGLSCLVPSHASVKVKNRRLSHRETYDPLLDSWEGKPLAVRKRLGEYILLGSIGRGSFGKVKLAFLSTDRQFFAVKVLSKTMIRKRSRIAPLGRRVGPNDSPYAQFSMTDVNEVAVMRHLNHCNVMLMKGVFDVIEEDSLFIVVELLPNGPVMSSSKLEGARPMPEDLARSAFVDVLSGLEYLHHKNVAHRDIKPDNLLKAGDGTVKISDFGAAVLYGVDDNSDSTETRSISWTVGTPAFTAPELCISDSSPPCPRRCFAADVWSLGATVFYMVYGRAPFLSKSVFSMYDAICTEELKFPETPVASKSLQVLIKKMLVKEPNQRATVKEIVDSAWLAGNAEVAEKVEDLRSAIARHEKERAEGNAVESANTRAPSGQQ